MDILKMLLGDKLNPVKDVLKDKANMNESQADSFIPQAAQFLLKGWQEHSKKVGGEDVSASANQFLNNLDTQKIAESIAAKIGVSTSQAQTGITVLTPMLISLAEKHKDKLPGILSMLDKFGGSSSLGSMLGGLGSKLFGR